jgi:hypothetical protein
VKSALRLVIDNEPNYPGLALGLVETLCKDCDAPIAILATSGQSLQWPLCSSCLSDRERAAEREGL